MSKDQNRRLAEALTERLTAGDLEGVLDALSDDATWWIAGTPADSPFAGVYDKQHLARLIQVMSRRLRGGLTLTVDGTVAEGNKVALEARSHGELKDGRRYDQAYHFLIELRDTKICAVREYLDTQHAHAVWCT